MVRLADFTEAIRVSWIRRYAVECTDDHWADIIDQKLNLNINTRNEILKYGPERFNTIIKAKIPIISNLFQSYKLFKTHFPTPLRAETTAGSHSPSSTTSTSQESNQERRQEPT